MLLVLAHALIYQFHHAVYVSAQRKIQHWDGPTTMVTDRRKQAALSVRFETTTLREKLFLHRHIRSLARNLASCIEQVEGNAIIPTV